LRRSGIGPGSAIPSEELLRVHRAAAAGEASGAAFEGEWAADQSSFSSREIFANSEVHMDKLSVKGFDYDFTLASYTTHVQRLIYQGGRDHLVERKRTRRTCCSRPSTTRRLRCAG